MLVLIVDFPAFYFVSITIPVPGFYLKVIVGAHAVMANGGVIAPVGMNMVALAAQRHAVPFVVVAGSHKVYFYTLSPRFATYVAK